MTAELGRGAPVSVAQSDDAAQRGLAPEELSLAKCYPKVVTATFLSLHRQQWEREVRLRHRHRHLQLVADRRRWVGTAPLALQCAHLVRETRIDTR